MVSEQRASSQQMKVVCNHSEVQSKWIRQPTLISVSVK